jgi:hypothetical protein
VRRDFLCTSVAVDYDPTAASSAVTTLECSKMTAVLYSSVRVTIDLSFVQLAH